MAKQQGEGITVWWPKELVETLKDRAKSHNRSFSSEVVTIIKRSLDMPPEIDVFIRDERLHLHTPTGDEVPLHVSTILVPILSQRVAAGPGQEVLETADIVGQLPFLKRMLRDGDPGTARALEVQSDSMTGIQLFDGDMVVFIPGNIRGDGIYVLRADGELLVKRVEFDRVSRKLRIMSENPRYPDRIESADGQTVEIVGKVYGWVHSHPY